MFGINEVELVLWRFDLMYFLLVRLLIIWFNFDFDILWLIGEVNMNDLEILVDWFYWYGFFILCFFKFEDIFCVCNIVCVILEFGWLCDGIF